MSDALPRLAAALEGRYVPERELGSGGMATVYLAHDVRHDRRVALKVLRPELAAVIGADRFAAEIKTTANLQHPHILPLFDSGTVEGTVFYVMPYVEGESLRDRLERERQLPLPDALKIATEVASALDYAHRHGVIHRDIKPENILLHDGAALVADFGIALAVSRSDGSARLTETGLSLGTPFYMSPEQAMGERTLDARADVYALGCVLYEMLTGDPPFTGSSAQAVVAKVLTEKPTPIRALRDTVPEGVEAAVLTTLSKLPADRFSTAADFATALASPGAAGVGGATSARAVAPEESGPGRRGVGLPVVMAVAVLATAAGWILHGLTAPALSPPGAVRFTFELGNPDADGPFISISPDGRRVIQSRTDGTGVSHVVARDLGSTQIVEIQGTEGATSAVYSADGQWITFTRAGTNGTWKVPAGGGPATMVADSTNDVGAGWMPDGSVLVTRNTTGIWRIPSDGSTPTQLTQIDTARSEFAHWSPQVLPGAHAFVFTNYATPVSRSRIEAYDFDSGTRKVLAEDAIFPRYAVGRLFYLRNGAIWSVAFDPKTLQVSGTPVPVQDSVAWVAPNGTAGFDVASDGTLVFVRASEWGARSRVVWADRTGRETPAIPDTGSFREPRLSPDGRWIALTGTEPKRDLWLYDIGRGVLTQLTHAPGAAFGAVWTPDSRSLIYTFEDPVYDLHRVTIDESAPDRAVVTTPHDKYATTVSPDGRRLVFIESAHPGLQIVPLSDSAAAKPFGPAGSELRNAAFSPDGRWITYEEVSNGRSEVYLAAADGSGGRRVVSAGGGTEPLWSKGGREIVYRRGDAFMAAPVDPATGDVGVPVVLFRATIVQGVYANTRSFDVTPDGSRFLLAVPVPRPEAQPVEVVLGWVQGLDTAEEAGR